MKKPSYKRPNLPALRVSLTSQCNLHCEYCPPLGENFVNARSSLSMDNLLEMLKIFYKLGFRQFGLTGGEPLLTKKFHVLVREMSRFKNVYLKLYTNGTMLKKRIEVIKTFDLIKLSLDTLDRQKYKEITKIDSVKDVLEGIQLAKNKKMNIRINTVLTQKNFDELFNLIRFCQNKKLDLKILDLNCFKQPGYKKWQRLYISPSTLDEQLGNLGLEKQIIYTTGNYGIPMSEFEWDGIRIRIKDTKKDSVYSPVCRKCPYFLCQEGLYHLTLTCDGKLKMCRHRADISVNLKNKTNRAIKKSISDFLNDHYFSSERLSAPKQVFLGYFEESIPQK